MLIRLTNNGESETYCIEVISTNSGVMNKPKTHNKEPTEMNIKGTERATQPKEWRFFHGRASILGSDGINSKPNGQTR